MKIIVWKIIISLYGIFISCFCLNAQEVKSVNDLPVQLSGSKGIHEELVLYLTGDGGWNNFNQQLVQQFEYQDYGVVTLNSRKYFWNEKSPDVFAHDFELLSNYYMKEWDKTSLTIVGYSFGADVAGFLTGRVSKELHNKIKKIVLLSPSSSTDFEIKMSDLMGNSDNKNRRYKVETEIEKTDLPVICIFGKDEEMLLKGSLGKNKKITVNQVPGDHRYNNDPRLILKIIGMK
jgi:type IV secretory pathway VirJ component